MVLDGISAELVGKFHGRCRRDGRTFFWAGRLALVLSPHRHWVSVRTDDIIIEIRRSGERSHEDKPEKKYVLVTPASFRFRQDENDESSQLRCCEPVFDQEGWQWFGATGVRGCAAATRDWLAAVNLDGLRLHLASLM